MIRCVTTRSRSLWPALVTIGIAAASQWVARVPLSAAQAPVSRQVQTAVTGAHATPAAAPDYVIGPEDQLSILFFQNHDMSADVVVRPDGKISLPLLNDITASGLTPDELREQVKTEALRFIQEPNPTVVVKQINSRKVFITGSVEKPGTYSLNSPTTVLQLIAAAGGLKEYADARNISIVRVENERQATFVFNYQEFVARKNQDQNIRLRPGDTVIVR